MKRKIVLIMATIYITSVISVAFAGGGSSGGALESTQLANKAQLIDQVKNGIEQIGNQITQITNQITMIQDMIHNTMNFGNELFAPIAEIYSEIQDVMNQTMGIVYTMSNFDEELKNSFKSYSDLQNLFVQGGGQSFNEEFRNIQEKQRETVRTTIEALGVSGRQIETDADFLKELQQNASTAEGRNEILDVANQFAAFQADQIMKIRQAITNFTIMSATVTEAEMAKEDASTVRWQMANENHTDNQVIGWQVNEHGY